MGRSWGLIPFYFFLFFYFIFFYFFFQLPESDSARGVDTVLRVLSDTVASTVSTQAAIARSLKKKLRDLVKSAVPAVALHATKATAVIYGLESTELASAFTGLMERMELDGPHLVASLSAMVYVARECPSLFSLHAKDIINEFIIKTLIARPVDGSDGGGDDEPWSETVSPRCQAQVDNEEKMKKKEEKRKKNEKRGKKKYDK